MTTYRVGPHGATVFDADGTRQHELKPGQVVVEGTSERLGSLAGSRPSAQHVDNLGRSQQRRRKGYADKALHPEAKPPAAVHPAEERA